MNDLNNNPNDTNNSSGSMDEYFMDGLDLEEMKNDFRYKWKQQIEKSGITCCAMSQTPHSGLKVDNIEVFWVYYLYGISGKNLILFECTLFNEPWNQTFFMEKEEINIDNLSDNNFNILEKCQYELKSDFKNIIEAKSFGNQKYLIGFTKNETSFQMISFRAKDEQNKKDEGKIPLKHHKFQLNTELHAITVKWPYIIACQKNEIWIWELDEKNIRFRYSETDSTNIIETNQTIVDVALMDEGSLVVMTNRGFQIHTFITKSNDPETVRLISIPPSCISTTNDMVILGISNEIHFFQRFGDSKAIAKLLGHKSEIVSIQKFPDNENLIASLSKDNTIFIWDIGVEKDTLVFERKFGYAVEGFSTLTNQYVLSWSSGDVGLIEVFKPNLPEKKTKTS